MRYRDVGYRDNERFTLCAIGLWCSLRGALLGYFVIYFVCYRDVRYRDVRYRDSERFTLCAIGMLRLLRGALPGSFAIYFVCYRDVRNRDVRYRTLRSIYCVLSGCVLSHRALSDPARYYYTLPGCTWDAILKYTNITFELLTDIDMVLFVERGIRGGLS